MIKNVIFDLDGTLADTIGDVAYIGDLSLNEMGLKGIPTEKYKTFVGDGAKKLCERMLDYFGIIDSEMTSRLLDIYLNLYNIHEGEHIKSYDGMEEALKALIDLNVKLFVISNKPCINVKNALKMQYKDVTFEEIIGGDSGFSLKPDTESIDYLIKKYGLKKDETAYVGDGDADVKLYQAADVFGISCLWGYRKRPELEKLGAKCFAKTPNDIVKMIQNA